MERFDREHASVDLLLFGWQKRKRAGDNWAHWGKGAGHFLDTCLEASINQMVRLSRRMVAAVLDFASANGALVFHEILFASLAAKGEGWSARSFRDDAAFEVTALDYHAGASPADRVARARAAGLVIAHPVKRWETVVTS
jgi:hypothetical protein